MVNDFVKIQRDQSAATEAVALLNWIAALRTAYELGIRVRDKMQHNFDDSGGENAINWSALETIWGIPAGITSVGPTANGATVYTFVNGAVGSMTGAFQTDAAKVVTERVG